MDTPTSKEPDTVETTETEQKVSTIVKDKSTTVERSETEQKVSTIVKDKSKLDIFLNFASALGTALAVALVGIFGSIYLASSQEKEANLRLYTELMSNREAADTSLRKEMFNSIIANFLRREAKEDPATEVLNLELLAYNFHDSLDLAPLFKDVSKKLEEKRELYKNKLSANQEQNEELIENPEQNEKLSQDEKRNEIYLKRLNKVARDVTAKQTAMLEEAGGKLDGTVDFGEWKTKPVVMDKSISLEARDPQGKITTIIRKIRIEVLEVRTEKKELEVILTTTNSENNDERAAKFTVDYFDFPMIDNVRLPQGFRGAIVLKAFNGVFADFTFVYFPSSRASLKEKPYYDEILYNLQPGIR